MRASFSIEANQGGEETVRVCAGQEVFLKVSDGSKMDACVTLQQVAGCWVSSRMSGQGCDDNRAEQREEQSS